MPFVHRDKFRVERFRVEAKLAYVVREGETPRGVRQRGAGEPANPERRAAAL